jgi:hypothetical protein
MQFKLNSDKLNFEFDCEYFDIKNSFLETVIITIIHSDGVIEDHCFQNVTFKVTNNLIVGNGTHEHSCGIFDLVQFTNPDVKTLLELFEKYDGKIISYNGEDILKTPKEIVEEHLNKDVYIVTGYGDLEKEWEIKKPRININRKEE